MTPTTHRMKTVKSPRLGRLRPPWTTVVLLLAALSAPADGQDCGSIGYWLKERASVAGVYFDKQSCCQWDFSTSLPPGQRKTSCNADGVPVSLVWRGELNGTVDLGDIAGIAHIDLSGNPLLHGPLLPVSPTAFRTTKALNLSGTSLSGRLPRMDAWASGLESFDVSNTLLTGFLPPMPRNLSVCRVPRSVCFDPQCEWAASTPAACTQGLPLCPGKAPEPRPPAEILPPLRPHWGDLPDPLTDHGLPTIREQCEALLEYITFHGADVNRTAFLEHSGSGSCCNYHLRGEELNWVYCGRDDQAIIRLELASLGLDGDINQPPNTMSKLKALGQLDFSGTRLAGRFPTWVLGMADLRRLGLRDTKLSGPVPNLTPLESLRELKISNSAFSGPLPAFRGQEETNCWISPQNGAACFAHDPEWSEPACGSYYTNYYYKSPAVPFCDDVPSVADTVVPDTDWHCYTNSCGSSILVRRVQSFQQGITMQCLGNGKPPYGNKRTACQVYKDSACTVPTHAPKGTGPADEGPVCTQDDTFGEAVCSCDGNCLGGWCSMSWRSWGMDAPDATSISATVTATAVPTTASRPSGAGHAQGGLIGLPALVLAFSLA
ncbi:hypothetical protein DFJ74DRAFT_685028 [Hyaloraphidium curvatum]|nr:hypothetical protein DFJ74DRAFT_685028 [Hyaloraphidium curvatum]